MHLLGRDTDISRAGGRPAPVRRPPQFWAFRCLRPLLLVVLWSSSFASSARNVCCPPSAGGCAEALPVRVRYPMGMKGSLAHTPYDREAGEPRFARPRPRAAACPGCPPPAPGNLRLRQVTRFPVTPSSVRSSRCPQTERSAGSAPRCSRPTPPGTPAALPGELLDQAVVDCLRSGARAGMLIPDAADSDNDTTCVSVHDADAD